VHRKKEIPLVDEMAVIYLFFVAVFKFCPQEICYYVSGVCFCTSTVNVLGMRVIQIDGRKMLIAF